MTSAVFSRAHAEFDYGRERAIVNSFYVILLFFIRDDGLFCGICVRGGGQKGIEADAAPGLHLWKSAKSVDETSSLPVFAGVSRAVCDFGVAIRVPC